MFREWIIVWARSARDNFLLCSYFEWHGCLLICLSIEIFMSKLDYCFEPYKSANVHATKEKNMWWTCQAAFHIKKSIFIIYLLEDEQELSLRMLILLQHIYNFCLFHAVILSFLDVLQSFYSNLISFWGLTYWHSAQC